MIRTILKNLAGYVQRMQGSRDRRCRCYRTFLLLAMLLFVCPAVVYSTGMGVTPPSFPVVYIGQDFEEGEFTVLPRESKNVRMYSTGKLKDSILINGMKEYRTYMKDPTAVPFRVDIPSDLPPGDHRAMIVIEQYLTAEEKRNYPSIATAFAAIGFVVKVRVPNTGKFLETALSLDPKTATIGEEIDILVDTHNFGTEDLLGLQADISIKDPDGNPVAELQSERLSLLRPAERKELSAQWKTHNLRPGVYHVSASTDYGGTEPAYTSSQLRLGDIDIEILNVEADLSGPVAKIFIDVQSSWNDILDQVYAELVIRKNGVIVDTLKTSALDLEPWGKGRLTAFWEKNGLLAGNYDIDIVVHYFDKLEQKHVQVQLTGDAEHPSSARDNAMLIGLIALAVLFVVNFLWYIAVHRKKPYELSSTSLRKTVHKRLSGK